MDNYFKTITNEHGGAGRDDHDDEGTCEGDDSGSFCTSCNNA